MWLKGSGGGRQGQQEGLLCLRSRLGPLGNLWGQVRGWGAEAYQGAVESIKWIHSCSSGEKQAGVEHSRKTRQRTGASRGQACLGSSGLLTRRPALRLWDGWSPGWSPGLVKPPGAPGGD